MIHIDAEQEAHEPEDCGDEGEGLCGFPLPTVGPSEGDVAPVPDAAAVYATDPIDENPKSSEPRNTHEQIKRIV